MTTYAVTGATGQLGRLAVGALLDPGVPTAQVTDLPSAVKTLVG